MPNNPVQVVLELDRFHEAKVYKPTPRSRKDFYGDRDPEFVEHKRTLVRSVERASSLMQKQSTDVAYARVSMRGDALAKDHRPVKIFRPEETPLVGTDDLGQLLIEVTSQTLRRVQSRMENAEETTRKKFDKYTEKVVFDPSRERQEVGAIDQFTLVGAEDRVRFSARDAVSWLEDRRTGGSYRVELFRMPPARAHWDALSADLRTAYQTFIDGLLQFPGLECDRLDLTNKYNFWLRIRLSASGAPAFHPFGTDLPTRAEYEVSTPFEQSVERHAALLQFLQSHPIVRRVYLSPRLERSASRIAPRPATLTVPRRDVNKAYPVVAVVDGGIDACLDEWVVERREILAPEHRSTAHGTFVAGLLVGGASFNNAVPARWESDGCNVLDVAICPDEDNIEAASAYGGVDGYLGELEQSVYRFRTRHGVRVFSVSHNTVYPCEPDDYSYEAQKFDEIADQNDVILVQSAGNLRGHERRPEWDADPAATLSALAGCRDPLVLVPAESVRNVSVAALNQPGAAPPVVASAPAGYSRRGPGLRCGVKPDVAHYGGTSGGGLISIAPGGGEISGSGTSFATPLAAKVLAALDHKIEGDTSRETLLALLIHYAEIPEPLTAKAVQHLARDFVGFGVPADSVSILNRPNTEITLVFAGRLKARQVFNFEFSWPAALTNPDGSCRGFVRMTMVASPPLDHEYKSEIARVNLDAALQQVKKNGGWGGYSNQYTVPTVRRARKVLYEAELIKEALKWSPVKKYEHRFPNGVGKSSSWRLQVDALARPDFEVPAEGVPFTVILTIEDIERSADVFNEMRASLMRNGVRLADIQTAARIIPRI